MTQTPYLLDPDARAFYRRMLGALDAAGVEFLVGGAYAFERYTGIERHTKDFDIFTRRGEIEMILGVLGAGGCRTELPYPHWLGKARCGDHFIDVIFSSGNGVAVVDDDWFAHAHQAQVLGLPVRLVPPEEMIWSKAYVMERERFDGADVLHLLRARGAALDWTRLLARFRSHRRVLFSHLVLFDFAYPCERAQIPQSVRKELWECLRDEMNAPPECSRVCNGTLLSREQYLPDLERWGYRDARLEGGVAMTPEHVEIWTAAISDPD